MAKVWNDGIAVATIANGAAVSNEIALPPRLLGALIFMPAALTQASLKITALKPKINDQEADVWQPILAIMTGAAAVTQSTVDGLLAAKAYAVDGGVLGGGVIRFETASGNEGAEREVRIAFRVDK